MAAWQTQLIAAPPLCDMVWVEHVPPESSNVSVLCAFAGTTPNAIANNRTAITLSISSSLSVLTAAWLLLKGFRKINDYKLHLSPMNEAHTLLLLRLRGSCIGNSSMLCSRQLIPTALAPCRRTVSTVRAKLIGIC